MLSLTLENREHRCVAQNFCRIYVRYDRIDRYLYRASSIMLAALSPCGIYETSSRLVTVVENAVKV
jgi:hypothetical protein